MTLKKTFFSTAFLLLSFSGVSLAQGPRDRDMWVKVPTDSIDCSHFVGGSELSISIREFYIVTAPPVLAFGTDKGAVMRERFAACEKIVTEKTSPYVYVNIHTAEVLSDNGDGSFLLNPQSSPDWETFSAKTISCSGTRPVEAPSRNFYEANRGMAEGHGTRKGNYYFSVDKTGALARLTSDYAAKHFGSLVEVNDIRNQCNSAVVQTQAVGGGLYVDKKTAEVWPEVGFYRRQAKEQAQQDSERLGNGEHAVESKSGDGFETSPAAEALISGSAE